jgi:hypothetical protein
MINWRGIDAIFDDLCISRAAWARKHGIIVSHLYSALEGRIANPDPVMVAALRDDGLLVEELG